MPTKRSNGDKFKGYTFHAHALAAHYRFITDSNCDFGPEYALAFQGRQPFKHREKTGGHSHPEISFSHSWVHVFTKIDRSGVYTTIAKSGLKGLRVKDKLTIDELEAGIMTVYREEWYRDPSRPKRARILPLPPVLKNVKICGRPYRLDKELRLPEAFSLSDAQRKKYFLGEGPEIEPVEISAAPGQREKTDCGEIAISADTRRIEIPDFGIVTFAEWKWLPAERHTHAHTAQWVQLVGLDLKNPGSGGGGGVGGNGSPSGLPPKTSP
jgi:hypothetical protein